MQSAIETAIEPLVIEFNTFRKGAAEHTIRQHQVVFRAKATLDDRDFVQFCDRVGLEPKSSKCRKFLKIGAAADWLLPIADKLPSEWTTIFDVAVLGKAKAEELIELGILHPRVTARELREATITQVSDDVVSDASTTDETTSATESCILQVDASGLSDQDRIDLYLRLLSAATPHGLTVSGLPERLAERIVIEQEAA